MHCCALSLCLYALAVLVNLSSPRCLPFSLRATTHPHTHTRAETHTMAGYTKIVKMLYTKRMRCCTRNAGRVQESTRACFQAQHCEGHGPPHRAASGRERVHVLM